VEIAEYGDGVIAEYGDGEIAEYGGEATEDSGFTGSLIGDLVGTGLFGGLIG